MKGNHRSIYNQRYICIYSMMNAIKEPIETSKKRQANMTGKRLRSQHRSWKGCMSELTPETGSPPSAVSIHSLTHNNDIPVSSSSSTSSAVAAMSSRKRRDSRRVIQQRRNTPTAHRRFNSPAHSPSTINLPVWSLPNIFLRNSSSCWRISSHQAYMNETRNEQQVSKISW